MSKVTVYSKPKCPQCDLTKNFLKQHNIEYTSIDISEDEEALAKIRSLGLASVPVVETEKETWTGFNPLKLRTLI